MKHLSLILILMVASGLGILVGIDRGEARCADIEEQNGIDEALQQAENLLVMYKQGVQQGQVYDPLDGGLLPAARRALAAAIVEGEEITPEACSRLGALTSGMKMYVYEIHYVYDVNTEMEVHKPDPKMKSPNWWYRQEAEIIDRLRGRVAWCRF